MISDSTLQVEPTTTCQVLAKIAQRFWGDEDVLSAYEPMSKEQKELLRKLDETLDAKASPKRKKFFDTVKDFFD